LLLTLGALVVVATALSVAHRRHAPAQLGDQSAGRVITSQLAITAQPARAASPAPRAAHPAHARVAPAPKAGPGQAGMRAFLDPETGTIGGPPSAALGAVGAEMAGQVVEETAEVVKLPNGGEMLVNPPVDYVIMQIDAKGHRVMRCVSDPKQAKASGAAPATKPEER
jgi:hypothetical protein